MSERTRYSATATVTVQLEINADSSWGSECSIKQVHEQAKSSVLGQIDQLFTGRSGYRLAAPPKVLVVDARLHTEEKP